MLHSILFQQTDTIHAKTIELKTGQIFQGRVIQLYPENVARMTLGTINVTAKLQVPLEKGERYWFRVLGGDGVPRLKVMHDIPIPKGNPQQASGAPTLLKHLGIPADSLSKGIVQRFVQEHIPFSIDNLRDTYSLLKGSSMEMKEGIQLVFQMIRQGLPLTKNIFQTLISMQGNRSMAENILLLKQGLEDFQLQGQFPKLYDSLLKISSDHADIENVVQHRQMATIFKSFINQLGLQHEYEVFNLIRTQGNAASETDSLKSLLLQFLKSSVTLPNQLKENAQFLVERLTGIQLLATDSQSLSQQIIVQYPVYFSGKLRDITIQWEGRQKKDGQLDEAHCRILFYLELEVIGETVMDMQIQNRIITLTVYNQMSKPNNLLNFWLPQVKEQLTKTDYHLTTIKWIQPINKETEENNRKLRNQYSADEQSYRGVDVRI